MFSISTLSLSQIPFKGIRYGFVILFGFVLSISSFTGNSDVASAAELAQAFSCSTVTDISEGECEALVAFYNSTDGANWDNSDGWLEAGVSPCDWYGVGCTGNRVTKLELSLNSLSGEIPPEINGLTHLENLDLANNTNYTRDTYLGGTLPAEIWELSNLTRLRLDVNRITGEIPEEIENLTQLGYINLKENAFIGDRKSVV